MELKNYQKKAMSDLDLYLHFLNEDNNLFDTWEHYWNAKDICVGYGGVPAYQNAIAKVPHVCLKVPTGGGKTFMACASVKHIMNAMPSDKPKVVVWMVPSNAILTQTIQNLSNVNHAYRQRLDMDFAGRVGVYTKDMLLNAQNFSPDTVKEMLTVCILSYDSLRVDSKKKDVRKVYQENGNLFRFAECYKNDEELLEDTPDTALMQILRHLSPVVIVDESHNAGSKLSVEMLKNLNPSFILDLTATPRKNSNILTYVDARELKRENMVKLPVIVYNRNSRRDVIHDAYHLRNTIERQAQEQEAAGGAYIRPIVLFQAQPKTNKDSETFGKVKAMLIQMGIPEEEIAIKTSKVDELGKTDLMNKDCRIKYIITVNALKEGWDCPFAYILASLANKTSVVDVEQILGRILRQPDAKKHAYPLLNMSYVLTCSNDFRATLQNIVSGLNKAGFTRKDCRLAEEELETPTPEQSAQQTEFPQQLPMRLDENLEDRFSDINPDEMRAVLEQHSDQPMLPEIDAMVQQAEEQSDGYNQEAEEAAISKWIGGELGDMLNQYSIQAQFAEKTKKLQIPQFFLETAPSLFGGSYTLLTPENLSDGFSLNGLDAQVSFELATGEMYQVDIQDQGEAVPKYRRANQQESKYLRDFIATFPEEKKIAFCTDEICRRIDTSDRLTMEEIKQYVGRIISGMTQDELTAMETAVPIYAKKIQDKIQDLEEQYREKQFYKMLDSGTISCRPGYLLPDIITPANATDSIPKSLYEAERNDMNHLELEVLDTIVGLENVLWWHRIIDRKGFRVNGFINHYPDFMVMTKKGILTLIEVKGDHLVNEDSMRKLKLGRTWMNLAGQKYRYFMVFKDKDIRKDGAYTLDEFMDVIKKL